jgi:hypothetical protein
MTHEQLVQLLLDAGFNTGWALTGETLTLWEHAENPPKPLIKPNEVAPTAS